MAISTRPLRTLSDIKTHSGRASNNHEVYRDYFQVGALELERWRRTKEREAASSRIASIDSRLAEIDQEKESLLAGAAACALNDSQPKLAEQRKSSGFRIKY
jgi:cytochrome c-type biogenesis protein CcmH/NrfG